MRSHIGKNNSIILGVVFITLFFVVPAIAAEHDNDKAGLTLFNMPEFNIQKSYVYNTTYDYYVPSRIGHDAVFYWGEKDGEDYISRITKLNGAEVTNYVIDTENENINLRKLYDNNGSVIFMNLTFEPASLLVDYPLRVGKTWVRDVGGISGLLWIGIPVIISGSTWGTGDVTYEEELSVPAGVVHTLVYETNMSSLIKIFGRDVPYNTSQKTWLMENGFFAKRQLFHEGRFKEELVLKEPIIAQVSFKPEILNPESEGKFTAFIRIPEPYYITDIDTSTIECNSVPAVNAYIEEDQLVAKFNMADLEAELSGKESVLLTISGKFMNGKAFEGFSTIKLMKK